VGRGDRVAWLGPNHLAFLEALLASGLVGAVLAAVNHRLAADQGRVVLADIVPTVVIQHAATDPAPVQDSVGQRIAVAGWIEGALEFEALVAESADDPVEVAVGMEDVCLLVRGPNVMAGYRRRPEATREVLVSDGWLWTGDAARRDQEGYGWIVDRVADRFLADGRPVDPGDVERVLTGHPSVADAGVVQVLGEGGGGVVAAVVLSAGSLATEQEILAYGRRHLAAHQAPASVTFLDRLPRNSVGKLLRAQLRALVCLPDPK
jgi:acyl-CoA synthetase (AMP-forming)/AMP-acid ligase II